MSASNQEDPKSSQPKNKEEFVQEGQSAQPDISEEGVTFEVVEETIQEGREVRHKGVYLLPNLFTTAALFSGFYAIVAAINGLYEQAAVAIFVSMIFDGLDGRVARMTHTQSAFGAEYDSLSDCISFGAAPALVSYLWALSSLGKIGWMVAFVYMACAALRLARFNVQLDTADKRYFTGLPSPSAAAVVAGMVWAGADYGVEGEKVAVLAAMLTLLAGVMMVSNVKYNSFKEIDLKGRVPFVVILIVVLAFAVISTDPSRVLLVIFLLYTLSGPAAYFFRRQNRRL
ncbi:MAG: CDP-diacylglycerol--serine O-phosphatidyltransferase [Deltaproteobacteria bacterium]|nr:MAG: CDP-diacylglycerol--serine O-phosphatidyltransferase [Deltaproteobacteria bacterium]